VPFLSPNPPQDVPNFSHEEECDVAYCNEAGFILSSVQQFYPIVPEEGHKHKQVYLLGRRFNVHSDMISPRRDPSKDTRLRLDNYCLDIFILLVHNGLSITERLAFDAVL
jgi:hypothetical protein